MSRGEGAKEAVARVARALGAERDRVLFVGGSVVALFALDEAIAVRPTLDVDCVVDARTLSDYYAFIDRLRAMGFSSCQDEGAPLCRLVVGGIRVDVMGTIDSPIGPTNRWYRDAFASPERVSLGDIEVLAVRPIFFVATKLEAFRSRGRGAYVDSHDIEDILTVVAAMSDLRAEVERGESVVARAVASQLAELARDEAFRDAVWGHFEGDDRGQARAANCLSWLRTLAPLSERRAR
jgi:hypothetical protein